MKNHFGGEDHIAQEIAQDLIVVTNILFSKQIKIFHIKSWNIIEVVTGKNRINSDLFYLTKKIKFLETQCRPWQYIYDVINGMPN